MEDKNKNWAEQIKYAVVLYNEEGVYSVISTEKERHKIVFLFDTYEAAMSYCREVKNVIPAQAIIFKRIPGEETELDVMITPAD